MQDAPTGVLLMAYGTPDTPADVSAYYTNIRGGTTPSPEQVENLRMRYIRVGGRTPLTRITMATCSRLQDYLNAQPGANYRVYVGMKYWHPFITDTARQMQADGIRQVIALPLAPHYSRISIGGYRKYLDSAIAKLDDPPAVTFVDNWHMQPEFLDMIAEYVRTALRRHFPADVRERVKVMFTAHSLPTRIREWDDPYERQLMESSQAVAERVGLADWRFAWQSAGSTGETWIGPDVLDYLPTLEAEGVRYVLQVPIGFVSDHLEIINDVDIEAKGKAALLGMTLMRTKMPNASAAFIRTLAAVVAQHTPTPKDTVAIGAHA
ncbi:MAG: ferrochelatase [Candidatus Chloroheliales bacterium]|nr:MAG: ferrochelatase [Chloroflexota bacterium]